MTLMSPQDLAWLEQDTPYLTRQHQSSPVFLWPTILSEQPCNPVSSTLTTHQHHLAEIWACPRLLAPSLACACTFTESVAVTPQEGRAAEILPGTDIFRLKGQLAGLWGLTND